MKYPSVYGMHTAIPEDNMAYTFNNPIFSENFRQNHDQIQKWQTLLDQRAKTLFDFILPHKKLSSHISAFASMPQAGQLYVLGLLNDAQFSHMTQVSEQYHSECVEAIKQSFDESEQSEQVNSILAPTLYEIRPRLIHPAFHHPIMDTYVDVCEKIKWAALIHDADNLNYDNRILSLEDALDTYNVFFENDTFESDARALDTCILLRNSCQIVHPKTDAYLHGSVNRFYMDTISILQGIPENEPTLGATKRSLLAYELFDSLGQNHRSVLTGTREQIMIGVINHTHNMLMSQPEWDNDWKKYLSNWFNEIMTPYSDSLNNRMDRAKKITSHDEEHVTPTSDRQKND